MKEIAPQTYYEEYENEGIAEDGFLALTAERIQKLGMPAAEVVRKTNRKLAIGIAVGATVLGSVGFTAGALHSRRHKPRFA